MSGIAFFIDGKPVPGWLYGKLMKAAGGDRLRVAAWLYHSRHADDIVRYVRKGFSDSWITGKAWESEDEKHAIGRWAEEVMPVRKGGGAGMESLAAIMRKAAG